jgi:peptidoglycan/xylan/chitin deacetylase (PgdA/CDA1 family)
MWVLTYHSISDGPAPLCISAQRFAAQLDFLLASGWKATSLRVCVDALEAGEVAEDTPRFAVTFDDGYRDFAEAALPILEERGIPATLFSVATDERTRLAGGIDGAPLLGRDELRELASAGVEIAGHGIDHVDLTGLGDTELEREVRDGRARLADWVGTEIDHFAYPFGAWDERVLGAVAREYRAAFTTQLAAVEPNANCHAIPRVDAFYLDDAGLRRAIETRTTDRWLRTRRWLRRARGSEPRRAIPQRAPSARARLHFINSCISSSGEVAACSGGFELQERY